MFLCCTVDKVAQSTFGEVGVAYRRLLTAVAKHCADVKQTGAQIGECAGSTMPLVMPSKIADTGTSTYPSEPLPKVDWFSRVLGGGEYEIRIEADHFAAVLQ